MTPSEGKKFIEIQKTNGVIGKGAFRSGSC